MATITRYVNTASTAGGDGTTNGEAGATRAYASLNEWEANEQTDLVSAGDVHVVKCSVGSGSAADTTATTVAGWTTGVSNFITIEANTGQEAQMPIDTSRYRLSVTTGLGVSIIENQQGYTVIKSLQIEGTQTASNQYLKGIFSSTTDGHPSVIRCCIFVTYSNGSNGTLGGIYATQLWYDGVRFVNNTAVCKTTGGTPYQAIGLTLSAHADQIVYNSTLIACNGVQESEGILQSNGETNGTVVKNCIGAGGTAVRSGDILDVGSGWGSGTDYNAVTDTSSGLGSNSRLSQTFTFVNAAGGDYHLDPTDTGARTFGTDLSGDATYAFSDDFDGDTRVNWDIGADEDLDATSTARSMIIN